MSVEQYADAPFVNAREDYWMALARKEILATYGDNVSVFQKAKSLVKFGRNNDVDTSTETVWTVGGDETYVTTNAIDSISSGSGSDTSTTVTIEYHTVSGTGTDAEYTFGVQTAALNGQTRVPLDVPCARVSRMYVGTGQTAVVGTVEVYENTSLTAGLPTDRTKVHLQMLPARQQSEKCATTISYKDYYLLTGVVGGVTQKTSGVLEFELQIRQVGGVFRTVFEFGSGVGNVQFKPYFIVSKNADVRIRATGSTTNLESEASLVGVLASVLGADGKPI